MHDDEIHDEADPSPESTRLSKKEWAKKLRREAYQRAKEMKKNDPREIERKAKAKEMRRAAYQKAKEKSKAARQKPPKPDIKEQIKRASELDERPLAPVFSLDNARRKAGRSPTRQD